MTSHTDRCEFNRRIRALVLSAAVLACAHGCLPPSEDTTGRPTGPATTTTKVAAAGVDVKMLDLFGDWFFILRTADGQPVFTRRGDFELRADGKIAYANDWIAQGFKADEHGQAREDKLRDLKILIGQAGPVQGTTRVQLEGNVNPEDARVGDTVDATFDVFDGNGAATTICVQVKVAAKDDTGTQLQFDVYLGSAAGELLNRASIGFASDGNITGQSSLQVVGTSPPVNFSLELDKMQTSSRMDASLSATSQDGLGTSTLDGYRIRNDGTILGEYSNGAEFVVGQFVIARFDNPENLAALPGRSDLFTETTESGKPRPAVSVAE